MTGLGSPMRLAVIVPMFNEAGTIEATLKALAEQATANFTAVFCDNNSTDNTAQIVRDFIATRGLPWAVVSEPAKGTGRAADTAARAAIAGGATVLARTDADCLPRRNWVRRIARSFGSSDVQMIAGLSLPRTDDLKIGVRRYVALVLANELAIVFGKLRKSNQGGEFLGPYMMTSGNNVAITSKLYETVGGFARTSIEEAHEDRLLIMAVRRITDKYRFDRGMRVYASARRIEKWGIINTLKWYAGHHYRPETVAEVDVR